MAAGSSVYLRFYLYFCFSRVIEVCAVLKGYEIHGGEELKGK